MEKRKTHWYSDKTTGLLNYFDLRKKRYKAIYFVMYSIMICISLICVLPIIWVALSGFKDMQEMYAIPPTFFPKSFSFGNVFTLLGKVNIPRYFKNSICIIAGCWVFDIFVNGFAGYVMSRLKPLGSRLIETLVFWTMLMPSISVVPLYMTFVDVPLLHFNLLGTFIPMWLMAGASAYNILLFRNFFNSIPMDYIEAARIDGCSDFKIFFKIILPLAKPIVMVVSIFCVTAQWGSFFWPYLILGNTDKEPIAVMLYSLSTSGLVLDNEYMLILFMSIIPPLVVFCIFSKKIMGGLDVGGIKG